MNICSMRAFPWVVAGILLTCVRNPLHKKGPSVGRFSRQMAVENQLNPFTTAVLFSGQLGKNYLEFVWFVPKTGPEF